MKPVKYMTIADFNKLVEKNSYWKGRWPYLWEVIHMIEKWVPLKNASEVLELGPYDGPIIPDADVMDLLNKVPVKYQQDASEVPWDIPDKKYTLFIALQVWEHLGNKQKEVFVEVMRIAKFAILSFPLNWNIPGDVHNGITEDIIDEWTLFMKPLKKIKIGPRIIYFFKF